MKKARCPKCHHPNVHVVYQDEVEFIQCPHCKYDETLLDIVAAERTSEKSKSPYKAGGSRRTQK
ncbi:hypothetical protein HY497_00695 [Candidatus Woesearchaeota archaeon]|nr:hypothetical protein [Candidatus Woesearchaeota archaeon]